MKVRFFVSSTAALLLAWLGVTYVRQVPWQAYPVLGRGGIPMAAKARGVESPPAGGLAAPHQALAAVVAE